MKKVIFLEVTDWEKEILQKHPDFLKKAELFSEKLTLENAHKFKEDEIISTFISSQLSAEALKQLENLKFIATRSTGFDHIDLDYCRRAKILVANVPAYGSRTVAEYTFGLMICLMRKIYDAYHRVRETGSFSLEGLGGKELFNKTLGVIGTGKIGLEVIKIAKGFSMKIIAYDKNPSEILSKELGFEYVSLGELLKNSDIITLHIPYNKETYHLIGKENINLIKKGAYLINTARGGIIETEALYQALKTGQLAGAALDVLEEECELKEERELLAKGDCAPAKLKNILLNHIFIDLDNVIVSPHNAFNTEEALHNIVIATIENIESYLKGKPINLVT